MVSWTYLRYQILPPSLILFFVPFSLLIGNITKNRPIYELDTSFIWGNKFSLAFVAVMLLWAIIFLKLPAKVYYGPKTDFGYAPPYHHNGFTYYLASVSAFVLLVLIQPQISVVIYDNIAPIMASLNIFALMLCYVLYWKGKNRPAFHEKLPEYPAVFEFYRGMELHPRIFNIDVKQFTNCRVGLMLWQILVLAFYFASLQKNGWNAGLAVNTILQTLYLAKFYWWETGYFTTLDITLDRAGFYICWGCLVIVPGIYTFSTNYFVANAPSNDTLFNVVLLTVGLLSLYINYDIDRQKLVFRKTKGKCKIWNKPATFLEVEYTDQDGKHKTNLLLSGYWGISRHLNYVFELLLALCWNLPGWRGGIFPFLYNIILSAILFQRIFRDEEKCSKKYGKYWNKYCSIVKYRLLPNVF